MTHVPTYPPVKIGCITRPTPEERTREGDRWVSLRTLRAAPVASAPANIPAADQPAVQTRALYRAVDQRHADARRKLNT